MTIELSSTTSKPITTLSGTRRRSERWLDLAGVLMLSLPFLLVAYLSYRSDFSSDSHAHLIEKALLAYDRGQLEVISSVYPPLPFLLLLLWPHPLVASILAALTGGATGWLLYRHVTWLKIPPLAQMCLLLGTLLTPATIFLATQSLGEMLALFLLLLAWQQYLVFIRQGETRAGFLAGLTLGLAFFASIYTAFFALTFTLLAPMFMPERNWPRALSMMLVLIFPTVLVISGWLYLIWLFSGDPWQFLHEPASSVLAYLQRNPAALPPLEFTWGELLLAPFYLGIGLLLACYRPTRLPTYLSPLLLVLFGRAWGLVFPTHFALTLWTLLALIALPRRIPAYLWPILVGLITWQLWLGFDVSLDPEVQRMIQVTLSDQPDPADRFEVLLGQQLAQAGTHQILADDRSAYRLIAHTGTARPFLLPADPAFAPAVSQPGLFVSYILITNAKSTPSDAVASRYQAQPPSDFVLEITWPGGALYRRSDAPPLLNP